MKISKIYIQDFEQFQNVELDFTDLLQAIPSKKFVSLEEMDRKKQDLKVA